MQSRVLPHAARNGAAMRSGRDPCGTTHMARVAIHAFSMWRYGFQSSRKLSRVKVG